MNKSIETQIAETLGVEIEECHEYIGELYLFSLKGTTNTLTVQLDKSRVVLYDENGVALREAKIKITLE